MKNNLYVNKYIVKHEKMQGKIKNLIWRNKHRTYKIKEDRSNVNYKYFCKLKIRLIKIKERMIRMNNLTMKQKIILGVVISIMLIVIGIYGYISMHQEGEEMDLGSEYDENLINGENNVVSKYSVSKGNDVTNKVSESSLQNQTNGNNTIEGEIKDSGNMTNGYDNLDGKIVIHITGAVHKTGILVLTEGARIADAIDAANGATEQADLDEVNLAYILEDGQKIYIPSKNKENSTDKKYITKESGNNVVVDGKNTSKGENTKVNINTATQSELETLSGIGPSIASKIIEYREKNGKFEKVEDLQNVSGIGDAKYNSIKDHVTVK